MVDNDEEAAERRLDRVFHALADRTRRSLLQRLAREPGATVTELSSHYDMSLNAVSKHLKVLERAGLLKRSRSGRMHRCSADLLPMMEATKALIAYEVFWRSRLDSLQEFLTESEESHES